MDVLLHPVALAIIGVLSAARMARLVTFDDFPPMAWLRLKLASWLGSRWDSLMVCPFCLAPYLMVGQMVWFYLLWPHHDAFIWGWLVPNLWWGGSYLAAIIVAYDMPED